MKVTDERGQLPRPQGPRGSHPCHSQACPVARAAPARAQASCQGRSEAQVHREPGCACHTRWRPSAQRSPHPTKGRRGVPRKHFSHCRSKTHVDRQTQPSLPGPQAPRGLETQLLLQPAGGAREGSGPAPAWCGGSRWARPRLPEPRCPHLSNGNQGGTHPNRQSPGLGQIKSQIHIRGTGQKPSMDVKCYFLLGPLSALLLRLQTRRIYSVAGTWAELTLVFKTLS